MTKGLKEALAVLIVTHVTHVERVERLHYVHNIDTFNAVSERVERLCYVEKKDIHIFAHNFLNIQVIFNPKKVLESWDLDLSNHTIQCNVCWSISKGLKVEITFDPFDIHGIGWYGWIENPLNIKEVMSKNVYVLFFQHNIIFRPFRHSIECIYIVYIM